MALTVTTTPALIDNSSIWDISTNLAEDSTHVNVRVETTLYMAGAAIAKKVKPKALTIHDYTDILRSKILWSTPSPFDETAGVKITGAGKMGSNLITGFANDGVNPWDTFSFGGPGVITDMNNTAGVARAYSDAIAMTAGKIYVMLFKGVSAAFTGAAGAMEISITNAGVQKGNIILNGTTTPYRRFYLQPRESGSWTIDIEALSTGVRIQNVTVEVYELNLCDWWAGYYVKAEEKYEDASGVTHVGANNISTTLNIFIDAPALTSAQFIASYICDGNTKLPLANPSYDNITSFVSAPAITYANWLLPTLPSGQPLMYWHAFIPELKADQIRSAYGIFEATGAPVATVYGSYQDIYGPIQVISFDASCLTSGGLVKGYCLFYVQKTGDVTIISSNVAGINEPRGFQQIISLIWRNDKGGWSQKLFIADIKQVRKSQNRQTLKGSTNLRALYGSEKIKTVSAKAFTTGKTEKLGYLEDLLDSPSVYWHRAAATFTPVFITTDSIPVRDDGLITPVIEFEYIP